MRAGKCGGLKLSIQVFAARRTHVSMPTELAFWTMPDSVPQRFYGATGRSGLMY